MEYSALNSEYVNIKKTTNITEYRFYKLLQVIVVLLSNTYDFDELNQNTEIIAKY